MHDVVTSKWMSEKLAARLLVFLLLLVHQQSPTSKVVLLHARHREQTLARMLAIYARSDYFYYARPRQSPTREERGTLSVKTLEIS